MGNIIESFVENWHFYLIIIAITVFATYKAKQASDAKKKLTRAHTMINRLYTCTVGLDSTKLMSELNRTVGKAFNYGYALGSDDVDYFNLLIDDYKRRTTCGVLASAPASWGAATPNPEKFLYLTLLGYFEGITKEKYLYDYEILTFSCFVGGGKKSYNLTDFGEVAYKAYLAVATYAYDKGYDTSSDLNQIRKCIDSGSVHIVNDIEEKYGDDIRINFKDPKR